MTQAANSDCIKASGFLFSLAMILICSGPAAIAQSAPLAGGGDVTLRREGNILHVSVKGPRSGLTSLCLGNSSRVRILHASAALGEALYKKDRSRWVLKHGFEWRLRDSQQTGGPTAAEKEAFFKETGWVANASHTGLPTREYRIRLTEPTQYLAVTFLAIAEPMAVSYWPAALNDDCKMEKIGQGFLPRDAQFRPETWFRLRR